MPISLLNNIDNENRQIIYSKVVDEFEYKVIQITYNHDKPNCRHEFFALKTYVGKIVRNGRTIDNSNAPSRLLGCIESNNLPSHNIKAITEVMDIITEEIKGCTEKLISEFENNYLVKIFIYKSNTRVEDLLWSKMKTPENDSKGLLMEFFVDTKSATKNVCDHIINLYTEFFKTNKTPYHIMHDLSILRYEEVQELYRNGKVQIGGSQYFLEIKIQHVHEKVFNG